MDPTRPRRLRDSARQDWYARWRCFRFARHLGFPSTTAAAPRLQAVPLRCAGWLPAQAGRGAAVRLCA